MKKCILILLLMLIALQLNAMDPFIFQYNKNYLKDLDINISTFPVDPIARWAVVKKAYFNLAAKYHPDMPMYNQAKWEAISKAYEELKKLLEPTIVPTGPTLQQRMEEARKNATTLINRADATDDPNAARLLYEEAIEPFKLGSEYQESTIEYGFGTVSLTYLKIIKKYYDKAQYAQAIEYGKKYIAILQSVIDNIKAKQASQAAVGRIFDFSQFNLPGYNAYESYNTRLFPYFEELKRGIDKAFDELRKKFAPIWTQAQQDFESEDINKIKNALSLVEEYLKYDYTFDKTFNYIISPTRRVEYVRGYLKLADAYLDADKLTEAREAAEQGLEINNKFYAEKKMSSDIKYAFEDKLNQIKQKEVIKIEQEVNQGDAIPGFGTIASWRNILAKLYKLQPEADKLIFKVWNKIIERAKNIGDIEKAYSYAQEAEKEIKNKVKNLSNYTGEMNVLKAIKIHNLNREIQNIQKKKDEINAAMRARTFANEADKFLEMSAQLAPLAKQDKKSRDWIINTYNKLIHSVDDSTKMKLARRMLEYENAWQGLDFVSYKANIEELLQKLELAISVVPQKPPTEPEIPSSTIPQTSLIENLLEALKQLIRSFSILQSNLLRN